MATNNRKSSAPEPVVVEKPVATPAQEAITQIAQLIHMRVPLTGPERDEIGRLINLIALALGMNPGT